MQKGAAGQIHLPRRGHQGHEDVTMPRSLSIVAAALLVAVAGAFGGCGGGGPDVAGKVCAKADSCGSLSGISAAQCANVINTSLGAMSSAARSDAEKAYTVCVGMADCTTFSACIDRVMQGSSGGTGGGTGIGGSGGGDVSGTGGSTVAGTGGSAIGGTDASGVAGAGGSAVAGTGGSAVGGSTGGSSGGRGGSSVAGTGGNSVGGRGGTSVAGTGGGATGVAGTGGTSTAPELITSAQNAYWVAGTVTKVTTGTADLNVDKNTT